MHEQIRQAHPVLLQGYMELEFDPFLRFVEDSREQKFDFVSRFVLAHFAALKERCPPRQKSRVGRLKAKVESLWPQVTVDMSRPLPVYPGNLDPSTGVPRSQETSPPARATIGP